MNKVTHCLRTPRTAFLALLALFLVPLQAQAAIPLSGFTIEQGARPYGLAVMVLLLVALGAYWLRNSD